MEGSEEIDEGEDSDITNLDKSGEIISDLIWMGSGSKVASAIVGEVVASGVVLSQLILAQGGG